MSNIEQHGSPAKAFNYRDADAKLKAAKTALKVAKSAGKPKADIAKLEKAVKNAQAIRNQFN